MNGLKANAPSDYGPREHLKLGGVVLSTLGLSKLHAMLDKHKLDHPADLSKHDLLSWFQKECDIHAAVALASGKNNYDLIRCSRAWLAVGTVEDHTMAPDKTPAEKAEAEQEVA